MLTETDVEKFQKRIACTISGLVEEWKSTTPLATSTERGCQDGQDGPAE